MKLALGFLLFSLPVLAQTPFADVTLAQPDRAAAAAATNTQYQLASGFLNETGSRQYQTFEGMVNE